MKKFIIQFIKRNKFLYNLAKKLNRKLNRIYPKKEYKLSHILYFTYTMKDLDELEKIKEHYNSIKKYNTNLLIIIDNIEISKSIHKLINENPDILFTDILYYKNYHKLFNIYKSIFLHYKIEPEHILEYIN